MKIQRKSQPRTSHKNQPKLAQRPRFLPAILAAVITSVSSAPSFAVYFDSPQTYQPWGNDPTSELDNAQFEVDSGSAALTVQSMDFELNHSQVHNSGNGAGVELDLWDAVRQVVIDQVELITEGGPGLLENGGHVGLSDSTVSTHGDNAAGLDVQTGGELAVDNVQVSTDGDNAAALHAHNNGGASVGGDSLLVTHGDHSAAIQLDNSGTLQLDGATLRTEGDDSVGISANNGAQLQVSGAQIDTQGVGSHGVHIASNGADNRIADSAIHTHGDASIGVMVNNASGSAVLVNTQVNTDGAASHGLYTSQGTHIDLTAGSSVHTLGADADGAWTSEGGSIAISDSSLRSEGANSAAAHALASGTLTIDHSELSSAGEHGAALHLDNGGRASVSASQLSNSNGSSVLFSQGSQQSGAASLDLDGSSLVSQGALVSAESGSIGEMHVSNSQLQSDSGIGFAIADGAKLQASLSDSALDTGASGLLAQVEGNGSLNLLSQDSDLRGDTRLLDPASGTLDLDLRNATWRLNSDSSLSNLQLDGSRVVFAAGGFHTLSIADDLSGNGSFLMNTDLASVQGDLILVGGHAEGQHELVIADSGREADGTQLQVVGTHGGAGQFSLYGDHVDAGAYRYNLVQQGDDWYLVSAAGPTDPVDPTDPTDPTDPGKPIDPTDPTGPTDPGNSGNTSKPSQPDILSKGSNVALGMQSAAANLYYAELGTLVQRLGELRLSHDQGGVWVRGIGRSLHMDENRSRAYDQDISGVEIGADRAIALDDATLYIGGMFGTSQARMDFGEHSSGKLDSQMLGAYATYLRDDGWYVDNVLKYNRMDGDVKVPTNLGHSVRGDYQADAVGVSVEVGKQIALGDGWFVEPQAQLSATHLEGPAYTSSDGLKVHGGDTDSLQGRLGVRGGRTLQLDSGMQLQSYVTTSYIDELASEPSVTVNGHKLDNALPGSRTEIGIGSALQVSAQQKVSVEASYANGQHMEQPWAVTLGYRYLW